MVNHPTHRISIAIEGLSHLAPIPVATRIGPLLTCSVTAPYDPGTRNCPDGIEAQIANIFNHVGEILAKAGGGWSDVAKMTFYAPDTSKVFVALNDAWVSYFPDPNSRPSRHTMRVAEDWGNMLVCADFLAFLSE